MIELGDIVQDIHTGFKGTAVVYSKFINQCQQFEVMPKVGKDNIPKESQGIDIQSLKIVKRGKIGLAIDKAILEQKSSELRSNDRQKTKQSSGGPYRKPIARRGY